MTRWVVLDLPLLTAVKKKVRDLARGSRLSRPEKLKCARETLTMVRKTLADSHEPKYGFIALVEGALNSAKLTAEAAAGGGGLHLEEMNGQQLEDLLLQGGKALGLDENWQIGAIEQALLFKLRAIQPRYRNRLDGEADVVEAIEWAEAIVSAAEAHFGANAKTAEHGGEERA